MGSLFTFKYWFNLRPGSIDFKALMVILTFVVSLAVLAFVFNLIKKRKNGLYYKIWNGLNIFCITNFVIGLFLTFFTYELIYFLSARFWFLLWGLGMVVWLFFIIRNFREIPKIKEKISKEKEYKKYIP